MNKIHKKLGLKTKSLGEEGNCEVFTSYMMNKNYTWNENVQKSESSRIVGTCIRKPGINSMRRKILDGYFCVDDLDFKNQLNLIECEYSLLSPYTFNDICMEFPYTFSLDEEKEIVFEELYASGNKVLESHNQKITKIQMLQDLSYFELINNMGLHGYGYKASSYLQFDLYSQKGLKT